MRRIHLFGLCLSFACISQSAPTAWASASNEQNWVSLYGGQESSFSNSDRTRLLRALKALGIEHRAGSDQKILVSPETRPLVQDLLAKVLSAPNG